MGGGGGLFPIRGQRTPWHWHPGIVGEKRERGWGPTQGLERAVVVLDAMGGAINILHRVREAVPIVLAWGRGGRVV